MILAEFRSDLSGFTVSGHSGYAEAGRDIVCAAASAMTILVCNAVEAFGCEAETESDAENARIALKLKKPDKNASGLISVLRDEFTELEEQNPDFVRVTTI